MIWEELLRVALLGTERSTLTEPVREALIREGIDPELPPEAFLLSALALYRQYYRAGYPTGTYSGELPVWEPAAESVVAGKLGRLLGSLAEEALLALLPEYLSVVAQQNKVLPPEQLPALFDYYTTDPAGWEKVAPLIGKRGWWLLRQKPAWRSLAEWEEERYWEAGNRLERRGYLRHWRRREPSRGIEALALAWSLESTRDKLFFLAELQRGLSSSDEPHLKYFLQDSAPEVQEEVSCLLLQLPTSAHAIAWCKTIVACWKTTATGQWNCTPPVDLPAVWAQGGIRQPTNPDFSERMQWVLTAIAQVSPELWTGNLSINATHLPALLAGEKALQPWLAALTQGCLLATNDSWRIAIVSYWAQEQDPLLWAEPAAGQLITALHEESYHQTALRLLQENQELILAADSLPFLFLVTGDQLWTPILSRQVMAQLQTVFDSGVFQWMYEHYSAVLAALIRRCPLSQLVETEDWLKEQLKLPYSWEKEGVEKVFTLRKTLA